MSLFLELFAGEGGLSAEMRRLGSPSLALEINDGSHFDLSDVVVFQMLIGWVASGIVWGAHAGTPCTSFTRARRGTPGSSMPGPVRSNEHINGLPNLSLKDLELVRVGNLLAHRSGAILRALFDRRKPISEENPRNSFLWIRRDRLQLVHDGASLVSVDQCMFGAPWRKRTGLLLGHVGLNRARCLLCSPSQICDRTGVDHVTLGLGKGKVNPKQAQVYPKFFCKWLAKMIFSSKSRFQVAEAYSLCSSVPAVHCKRRE